MALIKFLTFVIVATTGTFLFFAYSPILLDINPQSYRVSLPERFEKGLSYNERLSASEVLFEGKIMGPESLASYKGEIYTGLVNGDIIRIQDGKSTIVVQLGNGSRPLGLRFDKNGLLYFADALGGLRTLDVATGKLTTLLPHGSDIGGEKITFSDDLDIDDNGIVYMSDGSTRWDLGNFTYLFVEHDNSGRVIAYDTRTGKASILMGDLYFGNGIQLTHDKKGLLVAEFLKSRIIKFHLQGPKKGQREVFANLPGNPDNIRKSKRGGYWVAFCGASNVTSQPYFNNLSEMPLLRKVFARMMHSFISVLKYVATFEYFPLLKDFTDHMSENMLHLVKVLFPKSALVLELNENGEIVQSLHSSNQQWLLLSEVLEENGFLYLGSFINPYLGKVKL